MNNPLTLTRETLYILMQLKTAGYDAFLVGGSVRDLFRGKNPFECDQDFTTNATPEQITEVFPDSFYENQFGTVSLTAENLWQKMAVSAEYRQAVTQVLSAKNQAAAKLINLAAAKKIHTSLVKNTNSTENPEPKVAPTLPNFEITTYRSKEVYTDGTRKPQSLEWGESIEEDLKRRDFTINAMALTISLEQLQKLYQEALDKNTLFVQVPAADISLIANESAEKDLENNIIRSVGIARERFVEDALRMLRAIRLAVQLEMTIEPDTLSAITTNHALLSDVSFERIRDEFLKMLVSPQPKRAIELLDQTNLLQYILPELIKAKGITQGGHHTTDVWTHSLDALDSSPSLDPIVRLATLLHDIAKPVTYKVINGQPTFYNHEILGSRIARDIGRRLRLNKHQLDRLFILTRYHMFHYQTHNTDAAIRRLMRKVGLENLDDILDLREGDRLGSGARKTSWRLEEMKQRMLEQLNQPLSTSDLAIDGHDLMSELKLKPGLLLGKILDQLLEQVLENPELNSKPSLLEAAKTIYETTTKN